jgi:hypothetical protein
MAPPPSRTICVAATQQTLPFALANFAFCPSRPCPAPPQEMEERRRQLEEQGDSMASIKPVAQLRAAVEALRAELVQMDVRAGLLQHLVVKAM